jgi:hypothetical protein
VERVPVAVTDVEEAHVPTAGAGTAGVRTAAFMGADTEAKRVPTAGTDAKEARTPAAGAVPAAERATAAAADAVVELRLPSIGTSNVGHHGREYPPPIIGIIGEAAECTLIIGVIGKSTMGESTLFTGALD